MEALSILYDTQINYEAVIDYSYFSGRRNNFYTYALVRQASLLLVDHFKRDTYFYHNNPDCNFLFGSSFFQNRKVPDNFFEGFVSEEDKELFAKAVTAVKDAMRNDFLEGNKYYYFSFDLLLGKHRRRARRYAIIVFPYLYAPDDKLWVTGYNIAPSMSSVSGNLKLYAINESSYGFDMETGKFYREDAAWKLSDNEKRILKLSAEGFTEHQISDFLQINVATLKNKKMALFEKMDVNTIYAAISKAFKNGDI